MGVATLIVTDHNTIQGSIDVRTNGADLLPIIPVAAEYQSEKGDIIGLFLKEEVRSRVSSEIIQQIHAQGGIVVLPHPFKGHQLDDGLLSGADVIETYNSRCTETDNAKAAELAIRWNRPVLAGADAHASPELVAAINEFEAAAPDNEVQFREQLLHAPRRFVIQPVSAMLRPYSQMIKAFKTRNPALFLYQAKRMAFGLARGGRL
jgi:hypothetical protein